MSMRIGIIGAGAIGIGRGRASDEGRSRRDADRSVAGARARHEDARPQAERHLRGARDPREGAPPARAPGRRRAVRRRLHLGQVVRHRVGGPARPGLSEGSGRRDRRLPEWRQRRPRRGDRGPGALARLRHHHRRRHVRSGPRDAHGQGSDRLQDRRARRLGFSTGPGARANPQRRRRHEGHDQPLGRALVQAHRELHGESDRWPERARLRRGQERARAAAHRIHIAAEAIAVGRASGHEVEPIYGIDRSGSSTRRRGRASRTSSATWRPVPSILPAAGLRSCRT